MLEFGVGNFSLFLSTLQKGANPSCMYLRRITASRQTFSEREITFRGNLEGKRLPLRFLYFHVQYTATLHPSSDAALLVFLRTF